MNSVTLLFNPNNCVDKTYILEHNWAILKQCKILLGERMSVLKDVLDLKKQSEESSNKVHIPEGISFSDANKAKIIISVVKGDLVLTKVIRTLDSYTTESIVLRKDHIPFIGELLLEFYNKGNFNKLKSKLEEEN